MKKSESFVNFFRNSGTRGKRSGQVMRFFIFVSLTLMLMSCGSLNNVDKSLLNHTGMDLAANNCPDVTGEFTSLNANSSNKDSGCATCAK